jgi:hypothetical protein
MAEIGRLNRARGARPWQAAVTLVRVAIVLGVLVAWQLLAGFRLALREVVPALPVIGAALVKLLSQRRFLLEPVGHRR